MREMGVWDAQAGIDTVFGDVADLALRCRFSDCAPPGEPGCAVRAAAAADPSLLDRLASMRKLEREQRHLDEQVDARLRSRVPARAPAHGQGVAQPTAPLRSRLSRDAGTSP